MYSQIVEILNESFLNRWFLDSGSLLGVIRDGRFLKSDRGIDISVIIDDYENPSIAGAVKKLTGLGFVVSRYEWGGVVYKYCIAPKNTRKFPYAIDLHLFQARGDNYFCPQVSLTRKSNLLESLTTSLRKGGMPKQKGGVKQVFVNTYTFFYRNIFKYFGKPMLMRDYAVRNEGAPYLWFIPKSLFNGVESGKVEGLNVLISPDEYLKFRYGEWRIPVSDWVTLRDDGGIRKSTIEEIDEFILKNKNI